jgi:type II secretory pathway pseudopilin PulG
MRQNEMTVRTNKKAHAFTLTEMAIVIGIMGLILGGVWVAYGQVSQNKRVEKTLEQLRFTITKIQALYYTNANVLNTGVTDLGCVGVPVPAPVLPACNSFGQTVVCGPPSGPTPCAPCSAAAYNPGNPAPAPYSYASFSDNATCAAAAAGIFPSEMVSGAAACPTVSSPWARADVTLSMTAGSNACAGVPPGGSKAPNPLDKITYGGTFTIAYAAIPVDACAKILMSDWGELVALGLSTFKINANFGTGGLTPVIAPLLMTPANISYWCSAPGTPTVSMAYTFPLQLPSN